MNTQVTVHASLGLATRRVGRGIEVSEVRPVGFCRSGLYTPDGDRITGDLYLEVSAGIIAIRRAVAAHVRSERVAA